MTAWVKEGGHQDVDSSPVLNGQPMAAIKKSKSLVCKAGKGHISCKQTVLCTATLCH